MVLSDRSESKGSNGAIILHMYYVYILRTASNTLYIGVTENLEQRIITHNSGKRSEWIKAHPGAQLVYSESHNTLDPARQRETN